MMVDNIEKLREKLRKEPFFLREAMVRVDPPSQPDTYTESPSGRYLYGNKYHAKLRVELVFELSGHPQRREPELNQIVELLKELLNRSIT